MVTNDVTALPFDKNDWKPFTTINLNLAFKDAMVLANAAYKAIDNQQKQMIRKYFPDDQIEYVRAVFESLIGSHGDVTAGSDRLDHVTWSQCDLNDELGQNCGDPLHVKKGDMLMYTMPVKEMEARYVSRVVVCKNTWTLKFPHLAGITCQNACDHANCYPSWRMATMGEMVLHELV